MEIWNDIIGFEGHYQVSDYGRVRGCARIVVNNKGSRLISSQILKPANCKGYLFVALSSNDRQKLLLVHRLVARTFLPNPDNKREVHHKDFDKTNNRLSNLEWVTSKENKRYNKLFRSQMV